MATTKKTKQARTRWSELPKWAWAHGLRKNIHFRAEADTNYDEAAAELPDITTNIDDAQVIISRIEYHDRNPNLGMHRPILDLDFPAQLIPSSTEGHFHLYLDKPMEWTVYRDLLRALAAAGIIENGYAQASEARKYTAVRLPWVRKEDAPDQEPAPAEEEVELVDRVADEALATLPPTSRREQAPTSLPEAEDRTLRNNMREPLEDDLSRMQWQSPHRTISYARLRTMFGDRYQELLEADPTTGNRTWRQACRMEQQRQNAERAERTERQERVLREQYERMLAMDRVERQVQAAPARSNTFPNPTWADELRSAYPVSAISGTTISSPPAFRQAPFEIVYSPADRTIRDNRGRQLTEEDLYRAQSDLHISQRDLEGPRMEEVWERCYSYAMSRRTRRNLGADRLTAPRPADPVLANLATAYAPQEPRMRPLQAPSIAEAAE